MATASPTARSLKLLRDRGYLADVVERYNSFIRQRNDLFGMGDILAIRKGEVLLVQTTSYDNVAARVRKITDHENVGRVREAGILIHVHGWHKKQGRWTVREVDLS